MKPNGTAHLVEDWRTDCPFPNIDVVLAYIYGPELHRWTLAYTISGVKRDIRLKMLNYHIAEDPYYFVPASHPEAWFNVASYRG